MAVCPEGRLERHLRAMKHTCGLYSYKDIRRLLEDLSRNPLAVVGGAIINYGIITEYTEGYKSSHAVVDAIFMPTFSCTYCSTLGSKVPADLVFANPDLSYDFYFTCYLHREWGEDRGRAHGFFPISRYIRDVLEEFSRYYDAVLAPFPYIPGIVV